MKSNPQGYRDPPSPPALLPANLQSVPAEDGRREDRWRPWLLAGMVALFVVRPLYPTESAALEGDGLPVVILWLVLAVCWLLGAIALPRTTVRLGWTSAAMLALVALHSLAALVTDVPRAQRPAINMLWEWIGMGLAFFLARQFIAGRREARAVVAVMIALGAALSAQGLYQRVYEFPATRAEYFAHPDATLRAIGVWMPPDSPERLRFESRLKNDDPLAAFALTNSLAGYLAPWLIVAGGIFFAGRYRVRAACCALPILACLVLTRSRSGIIAALVGLLLAWFAARAKGFSFRLRRLWPLAMILVLLASTVIAAWWRGNPLLARAVQSFAYRTEYWQATGRMIADHPLWGVGPGNFQNEYTRNKLPQASEEVADPHNFLLEIGATSGIPALLSMLAVLATFFGPCFCRRAAASAPSEPVDDGGQPRFALAGAAAGFLLALPMSLISNGRIENFTWMVGLPVAAVCLAVLWPWVDRGELPAGLPAAGAAGVLIHLLSSGGIGFPGVAGSLWLLLALGLNLRSGDTPRSMPRSAALAALALAAMMLVACYLTGYGPVMHAKADLRQAQAQPERAEEYLTAVAADDPWDVRPWNQLAVMALATWEQTADSESLERFERYSAESFRREPNASPAWLHWADAEMKIFARSGQRVHLERAIEGYQRAISLYPNNPVYHAQLAMALETRGDHDGFRHEAAQALDLHNSTPHSDKQLPLELRQRLLRSNTSPPHKQD